MSDFKNHLGESLQDPIFSAEWDAQQVEREIMHQIVEARIQEGITQQELAHRCNMRPSNLCRLENGNGNPSVATLAKIAQGLGKRLVISLI